MADLAGRDDDPDRNGRIGPGAPPGLGRPMIAVAASAAVLALLAWAEVPATTAGLGAGSAGCLAVAAVVTRAGRGRDLASALLAVAAGVAAGWPLVQDTCAPVGIVLGPLAGLMTRAISKPRRRSSPRGDGPMPP